MHGTKIAADNNPTVLKVVAILFLVEGLFGAFDTTLTINRDIESGIFPLHINMLLIGFPICIGLLANRNTWRITGVILSWIQIVLMSIIIAATAVRLAGIDKNLPESLQIQLEIWLAPGPVGAAIVAFIGLVIAIWKYRILRKPDIRTLFN